MVDLTGKIVVITGATGFIGRYVAEELISSGALVYAVVRPDSPHMAEALKITGLHILPCEMADIPRAYMETMESSDSVTDSGSSLRIAASSSAGTDAGLSPAVTPFAFLHFAWGGVNRGEIDTDEVQQKNIDMSLTALYAAKELGCSVFMDAGSRVEYGITPDGVMEEHMECHPINAYGRAKLKFYEKAAELAREWGMTYYHLRFFSVYGVGDHPWSIISTLTRDLSRGKTVSLSACQHRWNFMEVRDTARAVAELLEHSDAFKGEVNIVNIASSDTRVLKDFVEEVYNLCEEKRENGETGEDAEGPKSIENAKCVPVSSIGTLEYGTFEQAKEGALSIVPEIKELERLTEGAWEEKISFRDGIIKLINANMAET